MTDETAWLIERADPKFPGSVTGDFLCFAGRYDGNQAEGRLCWMSGVHYAIRFARKEDAARFIGAFLSMQELLPHNQTMLGFRSGDARPLAVEHLWSGSSIARTA